MLKYILASILALLFSLVSAQQNEELNRFRAYPVFGFNMTQVDGDDLAGFNKLGVHAGVGVNFMFNSKFSTSVEILFNQKGSKSQANSDNASLKLILNYAEVPIQLNYHDKDRMIFGAGFSVGNLVSSKLAIDGVDDPGIDDALERWEFTYMATMTILIKGHAGLGFRYSASINSIGKSDVSNLKGNNMRNKVISIRGSYHF